MKAQYVHHLLVPVVVDPREPGNFVQEIVHKPSHLPAALGVRHIEIVADETGVDHHVEAFLLRDLNIQFLPQGFHDGQNHLVIVAGDRRRQAHARHMPPFAAAGQGDDDSGDQVV